MTKEIWLNLAVKDVANTQTFFESLGFLTNGHAPNSETMVSMKFGEKDFIINFFREDVLNKFSGGRMDHNSSSTKVMISFDAENEAEVDDLLAKAEAAGGKIFGKGGYTDGWMYGGGFLDLDEHQWNILYMDMSKMPVR